MTRGQIVVFHSEGITTSTEFNGDMYFPDDKWAGHGQQVVDALKDINTVDDYKKFVKAFNDEHFQYEEDLFYNPLVDGSGELTEEKLLDMTEGYYDNWFSDYLYFKNLRDDDVHITTMDGNMLTVEPNGILVLNFGDYEPHCVEHSTGVTVGIPEKLIDICENLDWSVHICDGYAELEKYSPAGEDFIFTVPTVNFVKEVEEYANDFDADEHAEMWVECRGERGTPSSIRTLIDDADAIQEMLDELAEALRKGVKK